MFHPPGVRARCFVNFVVPLLFVLGAAPAPADVVTDWNTIWLDCVRANGGPPCPIARAGAMVQGAVFDAVNSIEGGYEPLLVNFHAPAGSPPEAAAAAAAHQVLVQLYPGRRAILDQLLAASLAAVPPGRHKQAAINLGRRVGRRFVHARRRDGSDDLVTYHPGTGPGEWRPTFPDFSPPASPHWGDVEPWVINRGDQLRPEGPLGISTMAGLLGSQGYVDQFNEVKDLGARVSPSRTPFQTETAFFWANDVDGTYKPPGHLNHIAQELAEQESLTLAERARLFALLNVAMAEAGLVAWDCKYFTAIDFWRPIAAIREADTDGNKLTAADPDWEPLNAFTPPFPAYISGHATFGAAAAAIFTHFFGTDELTHTFGTDDPLYTGGPRTYHRFSDAAIENGRSRIYLGVHWSFDASDGYIVGTALGDFVYANTMRPIDSLAGNPAARGATQDEPALKPDFVTVTYSPAGARATIEYALPAAGMVQIAIHDVLGRQVTTLVHAHQEAGARAVSWAGVGENGAPVASGIYFARVVAPGAEQTKKIVIVR
jgi:hypothetical protein